MLLSDIDIFLKLAYFFKLSYVFYQSPPFKFTSPSLFFSTYALAKGKAYSKSKCSQLCMSSPLMARAVKYAETTDPRYPRGLWCVVLPV